MGGPSSLLVLALLLVSAAARIQLPEVHYPRETDPNKRTALDDFCDTYDATAGYSVYPKQYSGRTSRGGFWTGYILDFNSGLWKPEVSSRPLWQHWLVVCVPDDLTQTTAAMYMDGPGNSETPENELNAPVYMMCSNMDNGITAYLQQVPNEHISFPDHPGGLSEDGLIAYTWRKFLNESAKDPTWLLRLPMTRAGVNAMTAVQDFVARYLPGKVVPRDFLIAGASKRGWTTWTLAAVDTRVKAAVPMVMPIPDVVPNIAAEWRAYGNWSFALKDYLDFEITRYLFSKPVGVQAIADVVGPGAYLYRLTMPVWNIIACGDEFTLPDSPRFWWNKLPGEKYLRAIPNAEHSLACCVLDVVSDVVTFYYLITRNISRPGMTFELKHSETRQAPASITLATSVEPDSVNMWWAGTIPSTGRRDFRQVVCDKLNPNCIQPVIWFPKALKPVSQKNGTYTYLAQQGAPAAGWTGFLVQVNWKLALPGNRTYYWRITSEVNVVPDVFPFAPCPQSLCNNPPH